MPFYICSKLFHHAHNFEYTLQWAVHNPNINWLCEAVTLERNLKTKILSISSKEWMPRFANISVALLRHGKNINRRRLLLCTIFNFFSAAFVQSNHIKVRTIRFKQETFYTNGTLENFPNNKFTLAYNFLICLFKSISEFCVEIVLLKRSI